MAYAYHHTSRTVCADIEKNKCKIQCLEVVSRDTISDNASVIPQRAAKDVEVFLPSPPFGSLDQIPTDTNQASSACFTTLDLLLLTLSSFSIGT